MRPRTDREAEALGEDRRDGHNMPAEVADYEAGRLADDCWGCGL